MWDGGICGLLMIMYNPVNEFRRPTGTKKILGPDKEGLASYPFPGVYLMQTVV
jgi:hypothetical protein